MRDYVLAIALFLGPIASAFLIEVWRVLLSPKGRRRRDQAEAEAMAAEGFPPPGPPTADHPSP